MLSEWSKNEQMKAGAGNEEGREGLLFCHAWEIRLAFKLTVVYILLAHSS